MGWVPATCALIGPLCVGSRQFLLLFIPCCHLFSNARGKCFENKGKTSKSPPEAQSIPLCFLVAPPSFSRNTELLLEVILSRSSRSLWRSWWALFRVLKPPQARTYFNSTHRKCTLTWELRGQVVKSQSGAVSCHGLHRCLEIKAVFTSQKLNLNRTQKNITRVLNPTILMLEIRKSLKNCVWRLLTVNNHLCSVSAFRISF